ncbi:MAG TPA: hypothetical protein VIQ30_18890 [Pseudonocardia sp.]
MAKIAAMLGMPLMPWQRYVADVALEVDPGTGWWAYDVVVMTVPRRGGKSALQQAVFVHRLAAGMKRKLWMSAQNGEKALELWAEVVDVLDASEFAGKCRAYTTTGRERLVWLPTRSELKPFAPNGDLLHSKAIDLLSLDELWYHDAPTALKMKAGYRPTFLTTNAQAWFISTAGTRESTWLNQERASGRAGVEAGANRGTAYFEWSVPSKIHGTPVKELPVDELVKLILSAHPAYGTHPLVPPEKLERFIREDLEDEDIGLAGVLRAYGNITAASTAERLIPESVVLASTTLDRIPVDVVPGVAFDIDPDRRAATIAAACRLPDGRGLMEIVEHGLGTRWTAAAVIGVLEKQGLKRVTANNAGPARDVADEIERAGFEVQRVSAADYAAACVRVNDELKAKPDPTVQHYGQKDLVDAMGEQLTRRRLGASWAFDTDGEPVTPLTAGTLALWAADHPPEPAPDYGRFRVL